MRLPFFQVNAFTRNHAGGNPAGVCVVERWPTVASMLATAAALSYAEVAFVLPASRGASIRWFSPTTEVDLCGHATLAAVHVLYNHLGARVGQITVDYADGSIQARRQGEQFEISLPVRAPSAVRAPDALIEGLGSEPEEVLKAVDYLVVLRSETVIRNLKPNLRRLAQLRSRGVIVTAPGDDSDFVSRYFAPALGIDEDHATGSSHCTLAPYWAHKLGRPELIARQLSPRGAEIGCTLDGEKVWVRGETMTCLEGTVIVP